MPFLSVHQSSNTSQFTHSGYFLILLAAAVAGGVVIFILRRRKNTVGEAGSPLAKYTINENSSTDEIRKKFDALIFSAPYTGMVSFDHLAADSLQRKLDSKNPGKYSIKQLWIREGGRVVVVSEAAMPDVVYNCNLFVAIEYERNVIHFWGIPPIDKQHNIFAKEQAKIIAELITGKVF